MSNLEVIKVIQVYASDLLLLDASRDNLNRQVDKVVNVME
jgi:hypothetical protein